MLGNNIFAVDYSVITERRVYRKVVLHLQAPLGILPPQSISSQEHLQRGPVSAQHGLLNFSTILVVYSPSQRTICFVQSCQALICPCLACIKRMVPSGLRSLCCSSHLLRFTSGIAFHTLFLSGSHLVSSFASSLYVCFRLVRCYFCTRDCLIPILFDRCMVDV